MVSWTDILMGSAVVCLILLTVGFAFLSGMWLGRRASQAAAEPEGDPDRMADMINGLHQWTSGIARDVTEFRSAVGQLSNEVDRKSGDTQAGQIDPAALRDFQSAHQDLQDRLTAAEATLQQQAQEIEVFVSEARTDALTGISNRRAFDEEMSRRYAEFRRYAVPVCVLLIDVDHFKSFNDKHGHQVGDAVLKETASRLSEAMRESDVVARYGGEEFAVILVQTALGDSCRAAERARFAIDASPYEHENQSLSVTVSCGVAQASGDESISHLIQRADKALYAAKASGRNAAFWHDGENCLPITQSKIDLARHVRTKEITEEIPAQFTDVCNDLRQRLADISR